MFNLVHIVMINKNKFQKNILVFISSLVRAGIVFDDRLPKIRPIFDEFVEFTIKLYRVHRK